MPYMGKPMKVDHIISCRTRTTLEAYAVWRPKSQRQPSPSQQKHPSQHHLLLRKLEYKARNNAKFCHEVCAEGILGERMNKVVFLDTSCFNQGEDNTKSTCNKMLLSGFCIFCTFEAHIALSKKNLGTNIKTMKASDVVPEGPGDLDPLYVPPQTRARGMKWGSQLLAYGATS